MLTRWVRSEKGTEAFTCPVYGPASRPEMRQLTVAGLVSLSAFSQRARCQYARPTTAPDAPSTTASPSPCETETPPALPLKM